MKKIIFVIILSTLAFLTSPQIDEDPLLQQQIEATIPEPTEAPKQEPILPPRKFQLNKQTLYMYRYEVGAIIAVFIYLIIYKRGKAANADIMQKFYVQTREILDNNFSHVGFTNQSHANPFVAESPSEAMFYASGRQNCYYFEMLFNTRKRQDLIYHLFYEAIYPEKDTVTIDIPIKAQHLIVFCLINRKKVKAQIQKYLELSKLTSGFQVKNLPSSFSVLGESADIVDLIVDNQTMKKLQNLSNLIVSIHYTDQKTFSTSQGHIRAVFNLSKKNEEKYGAGVELLLYLTDKFCNLKVSSNYKNAAQNRRNVFNASKEKQQLEKHQQELRKKKQDKKRSQEAWLRSLPPEKQKREDEKRKKKELNKQLKSKTMKVM